MNTAPIISIRDPKYERFVFTKYERMVSLLGCKYETFVFAEK